MVDKSRKQLRRTTFIYWTLLLYIVAALVWWFVTLERQNREVERQRFRNLELERPTISANLYAARAAQISNDARRNTTKYVGEGVAFLILISIGAVFVYRSVRKQFVLQLQQQNFMMAVTHELKTPISVVKLNLETLQKYSLDPEKQKKMLRNTLDEMGRLNFLTNNILISSQLEGGGYPVTKEELDLSGLLHDCIQDFRDRFPDRAFIENIQPDADVKGDPLLLQMLINNLVENAIKYTPKELPVTAALRRNGSITELEIVDEGTGIEEEEKKKIFSKFYRIGNEATRKTQGTGLGLYLCRIIAKDHNADISVTNNIPHGSRFAVIFKQ